jgi:hypothetical protein
VLIVLKSGSLNLLEPSGPVKACNGIALSLPAYIYETLVTNLTMVTSLTIIYALFNFANYVFLLCLYKL